MIPTTNYDSKTMNQKEDTVEAVRCWTPFIQIEEMAMAKAKGKYLGQKQERAQRTQVVLTKFETHPGPVIRTRSNWVTPELLAALEATSQNGTHVTVEFGTDSAATARLTIAAAAKRRGYVSHSTLTGPRKLAVSFEKAE